MIIISIEYLYVRDLSSNVKSNLCGVLLCKELIEEFSSSSIDFSLVDLQGWKKQY